MSRPRIHVSSAAHAVRRWLGIDTWGMDFFRAKRRIRELQARVDQLEAAVNDMRVMAVRTQPILLQTMESRITSLEHDIAPLGGRR